MLRHNYSDHIVWKMWEVICEKTFVQYLGTIIRLADMDWIKYLGNLCYCEGFDL